MRLILDECLPRKLKSALPGHDVITVPEAGLAGFKNGELLAQIAGTVDAFITIDGSLPSQQSLSGRLFGVIVIRAASNRLNDLLPLAPRILLALEDLKSGEVVWVGAD